MNTLWIFLLITAAVTTANVISARILLGLFVRALTNFVKANTKQITEDDI